MQLLNKFTIGEAVTSLIFNVAADTVLYGADETLPYDADGTVPYDVVYNASGKVADEKPFAVGET